MTKPTVIFNTDGEPDAWRSTLVLNKYDAVKTSLYNIATIVENHEYWRGRFRMNEFANKIMIDPPPGETGDPMEFNEPLATELAIWLGRPDTFKMTVSSKVCAEVVEGIARRRTFHPVRDWLESLEWDGTDRLPHLFEDYFGAVRDEYTQRVGVVYLLSAVARIYEPGCQVDTMVVLEGRQGAGKTQATRALFSPPWYAEAMESPTHKDFYQSLVGRWGVEIGEMTSFSKTETSKVKQAITSRWDIYRPSYGRTAREFPRHCIFIGTTNKDDWQRDETGGRRYLPIRCGEVNVAGIRKYRELLLAEAVERYKRGENWHELPAQAVDEQELRFQVDSWEDVIIDWIAGRAAAGQYPDDLGEGPILEVTLTQVMTLALRIDLPKQGKPEQMRVANILTRLGWKRQRVGKERKTVWTRPPPT